MQSDDMLQYFTDLSMKMDGSKVLKKARQLLLKFRQLPFIPCSLRGLLSGPGIWDSAPLPSIECHCHGLCSSARRHSGSLTDTDVDIMMKSKGKIDLVREEKAASQEIPNDELSSSTSNYSNYIKEDDVNCTENEEREPDRKRAENQEIPEEDLSSPASQQSSCSTNSDANRTENNECELGEEEKPENQEVPNEASTSNKSNIIIDSDVKKKDYMTDLIIKEKSEMGDISKEELNSSYSENADDDNEVKNKDTVNMNTEELPSSNTRHAKSSGEENDGVVEDLSSNSKQPSSITTEEYPEHLDMAIEERAERDTKNETSNEDNMVWTTNAKEFSEDNTEQDTMEEKEKTLHNDNIKHVKDLMNESSKTSIIQAEGTAELASEATN